MRNYVVSVVFFSTVIPAIILSDGDPVYWDANDSMPEKRVVAEHTSAACGNCHQFFASVETDGLGEVDLGQGCRDCHNSQPFKLAENYGQFHADDSRSCAECHSFHDVSRIKAGSQAFRFDGSDKTRFLCRTCHNREGAIEGISAGHRAAREYYHRDSQYFEKLTPSATCQECHSGNVTLKIENGEFRRAIHINSLASHPIGRPLGRMSSLSDKALEISQLYVFDGQVDCQTCHRLNSGSNASLHTFDNQYDLCWSCHSQGRTR